MSYSLNFNGNSRVYLSGTNKADIFGDITIEMLIKPTDFATYQTLVTNREGTGATTNYEFGLTSGVPYFFNGSIYTFGSALTLNQTYHLCLTVKGGVTKLYINGLAVGSPQTATTGQTATSYGFKIGGLNTGSQTFTGFIDEVRIWNIARNEQDIIDNIYVKNITHDNLVFSFGFDEGSGNTTISSGTNNSQAIIENAVWVDEFVLLKEYVKRKILLKSNNKVYSLKPNEQKYNLAMTSNTTPAPFVVSASSELSGYPAWKAFDGTSILANTWFSNGVKNGWIQIKFDTIKKVNFVDLKVYNLNSSPRELSIEYSDDGIKWDVAVKKIIKAEWNVSDSNRIYFNNIVKALYFRINIYDTINNVQVGFTEITYGYFSKLHEVPTATTENFIKYGTPSIENFNSINISKNYILQDTVSEDTDGLWKQELNRKPLSIKFE